VNYQVQATSGQDIRSPPLSRQSRGPMTERGMRKEVTSYLSQATSGRDISHRRSLSRKEISGDRGIYKCVAPPLRTESVGVGVLYRGGTPIGGSISQITKSVLILNSSESIHVRSLYFLNECTCRSSGGN
jgi:hypothetical protein